MPWVSREELHDAIPNLSKGDQKFAQSLLDSWARLGKLSPEQGNYACDLVNRANAPKPAPQTTSVGSFEGVIALFNSARKHLRFPKIRLQVDGQPLVLSVAGPKSKAPGCVNVTDGAPFGQNKWFGRVSPSGAWTKGREATPAIETFLRRFSERPAEVAAEYGKLTGACCFCGRALTDEHSTAVGYGPICAANYELTAQWKAALATNTENNT